jgi:hypothetical protein
LNSGGGIVRTWGDLHSDAMIKDWPSSRGDLVELVLAQTALIERLEARVVELEGAMGRNSGNPSLPPSRDDAKTRAARRQAKRERGKRAPGKQPGDPRVAPGPRETPIMWCGTRRQPAGAVGPAWATPS